MTTQAHDPADQPTVPDGTAVLVVADCLAEADLLRAELEASGYRGQVALCTLGTSLPPAPPPGVLAVVAAADVLHAWATLQRWQAHATATRPVLLGYSPGASAGTDMDPAWHGSLTSLLALLGDELPPARQPAAADLAATSDTEQQYRDLFERATDAILVVDLGTLRVLRVNQRVEEIYGYQPAQMADMSLLDLVPREEHLIMIGNIERLARGERSLHVERRTHICLDGHRIEVTISAGLVGYDGYTAMQAVIRDETRRLALETELVETNALLEREVTQRREAQSKATYLALHDELTGLANRRLFFAHLDQALTEAARTALPFAVVFLDLDGLKPVNDELGHHAGDLLLRAAAERFRRCMRAADTLARLAGDEFGMLLRGMDNSQHCAAFARKVLATLRQPLDIEGQNVVPSASLGISVYPEHGRSAESLVRLADAAMYEAKRAGKGTFRMASKAPKRVPARRRGMRRASG